MSRKTVATTLAAAGLVAAGSAGASGLAPLVITGENFSATEIAGHVAEDLIVSVGADGVESVILLAQSQGVSGEAVQEGARTGKTPAATKGRKPGPGTSTICCVDDNDTRTIFGNAISDDIEPAATEEKLRPGKPKGKGKSWPGTVTGAVGAEDLEGARRGKLGKGKGSKLPCPDCTATIIIDGAKDMIVTD